MKLSDISGAETDRRIREEAAEDFLPEVERVMQSSGVSVLTETGNMNAIPALLPVYFIKYGKLTAVMNGQTGQITVTKEREKRLIGRRDDRKVGIFSMFGVGRAESDGKKLTLFRLIKSLGGIGIVLAAVMLFTLFGSIAAILG